MKKPSILVIPDSHARPDVSNRRFEALGNFIADKKPDIVVNIGDFADMGSLSSYDKGTLSAEGQRYMADIEAVVDAQEKMFAPVNKERNRLLKNKKKQWNPEFYLTLGNHENRINRACHEDPRLFGAISTRDLMYEEYGWTVVPFLVPLVIENICFQHYFVSGVMGRPVSGENHAASLVKKQLMSCVAGHSHMRDYWEKADAMGRKRFGLVVGCYDEGGHHYATSTQHNWWSGLCMLHECHDGQAEPSFYSLPYILDRFL